MAEGEPAPPRSEHVPLSEQLEQRLITQVVISIGIVLILMSQIIHHTPEDSAVRAKLGDEAAWVIRMAGSEQQWGVFAPDPRDTSLQIEGHITFADGTTAVWELPQGARLVTNLRYYRWRKWLERVVANAYFDTWEPTARWLAEEYDGGPAPVEKVELVRRFHKNSVEGPQPPYRDVTFCTLELTVEGDGC